MDKIKEPAVANMFYSGNAEELKKQFELFKKDLDLYEYSTRAIIVPHAGYRYSGKLAYRGISQLDKNIENIFIFAPAHKVSFNGLSLSSYEEWKTPLGNIKINQDINKELENKFKASFYDESFENEHSIEVQIPIIQDIFNNAKIIPILIGMENPKIITDIINEYYKNPKNAFIVSSDLSHFLKDTEAKKIDNNTAMMIETGNIQKFSFEQACGAIGICGLVNFANINKYSLIRVDMYNSSKSSNDFSSVVGYGAWILYEGTKNNFIKKYYSKYTVSLCREVILSKFSNINLHTNHKSVFEQYGASFVTLKKHNSLRGCIGSIISHRPLINDLIHNSLSSAFRDPRFKPLEKSEIDDLTINISLLSEPEKIIFSTEEDLLNKIVPHKDGIIIKDGDYQAVYLPSVWEELPDKEIFLKSLKIKAGMEPEYFSDTFEAYRFEADYI